MSDWMNWYLVNFIPASLLGGIFGMVFLVAIYDSGAENLSLLGRILTLLIWIVVLPLAIYLEVAVLIVRLIFMGQCEYIIGPMIYRMIRQLFDTSKTIKITVERQ